MSARSHPVARRALAEFRLRAPALRVRQVALARARLERLRMSAEKKAVLSRALSLASIGTDGRLWLDRPGLLWRDEPDARGRAKAKEAARALQRRGVFRKTTFRAWFAESEQSGLRIVLEARGDLGLEPTAADRPARDHWDWSRSADSLRRRRRWRQALDGYRRAVRLNPLDTTSREAFAGDLVCAAECLSQLRRFQEAFRGIEEASRFRRELARGPRGRLPVAARAWSAYLREEGLIRGTLDEAGLFHAVIISIWQRQGVGAPCGRQTRNDRLLRRLVHEAWGLGAGGRKALLSDLGFFREATLIPSMGGEIEEIRSHTRQELAELIRRYGGRSGR